MPLLFLLQFTLPLFLIGLLVVKPPTSFLGFFLQIAVTAGLLVTAGMTGVWLLPPWWAPYAYGGLLLLGGVAAYRKTRPFASRYPSSLAAWAGIAVFAGLGALAVTQAIPALASRTPPPGEVVELAFPLGSGTYLIVNGGSNLSTNAHLKTLDATVPRFQALRGQSYGVDIVKIGHFGLRADAVLPADPGRYRIYGADVLAPCAGDIVLAVDGVPDMQVPQTDRSHMAGNYLLLRCEAADVLLGHLKPGSLKVTTGARVAVGDHLAAAGNSGNTDEPHLHIHAQRQGTVNSPLSGDPLPVRFHGRYLLRNERVIIPDAKPL